MGIVVLPLHTVLSAEFSPFLFVHAVAWFFFELVPSFRLPTYSQRLPQIVIDTKKSVGNLPSTVFFFTPVSSSPLFRRSEGGVP